MADSCEPGVVTRVDPERVYGLQRLLDPDARPLQPGDALPALWHWGALPRWPDPAGTGHDGHPRRPAGLEGTPVRRMFAGGEVTFAATPLRVGDQVTVTTEVGDVVHKSGRSGEFVLATFTSRVSNLQGAIVVTERQDVVYTDPRPVAAGGVPSGALPIVGRPLTPRAGGGFDLATDPTVLLRFSAITANAHRIHYDLDYAQQIEGLPGLLVHGPFLTIALAQTAAALWPGLPVRRIAHRNLAPLFCGQPAQLIAREDDGRVVAEARSTAEDATVLGRVEVEYVDPAATTEETPA